MADVWPYVHKVLLVWSQEYPEYIPRLEANIDIKVASKLTRTYEGENTLQTVQII